MSRLTSLGLRARLVLMVAAILVPLGIALLLVLRQGTASSEEQARFDDGVRAEIVARGIERQVDDLRSTLASFAGRPLVQEMDPNRCDPGAATVSLLVTPVVDLRVVDLEGDVLCSAVPIREGEPTSVDSPAWREEIRGSEGFAVRAPFVDTVTGLWVTLFAQPIRRDGVIVGFVAGAVGLEQFSAGFRDVGLAPGAVITVVDQAGHVIGRTDRPQEWVGRLLPRDSVFRRAHAGAEGSFRGRGLDGEDRFFGYASVPASGWSVYSSTPADVALATSRSNVTRALVLVAIALLGGGLLSLLVARSVGRPLAELAVAADSAARGRRVAARAVRDGPPEVKRLATSVNAMLDTLVPGDESEGGRRFNALAAARHAMIWVASTSSAEDFYTQGWLTMRGRTLEEEAGVGWREGLHPDDLERVSRDFDQLWADPREYVLQYRIADAAGEYRWIVEHGIPYHGADGAFEGFVGTDADITDQLRAERERLETEVLFDTAMEAAPVGVGFVDTDLRYVRVNRTLAEFHEVPVEEHVGRTIHEVVGTRGLDLERHYREVLETRRPVLGVETGLEAQGARRYLAHYHPVLAGDEVIGVGIVTIDITERRELEAQLLQAQKLEAVGRLAGGVAHDFNNLLGVVTGYADLIVARLPDGDELRDYAAEITRAGMRGADLTRSLLAFSRDQAVAAEDVDVRDVLSDLGRLLERLVPGRILLRVDTGSQPAVVHVDVSRLGQVIVNLVVNAVDAMPSGGTLGVRLACDDDTIRLEVEDTGEGIPPDDLDRVFEPFYTTKESGSGLGLSTVHGIVEQAGGIVSIASDLGRGTLVTVRLPRVQRSTVGAPRQADEVETEPTGLGETVLVAEDSELLRNLVQSVLERAGYEVVVAPDGEAALAHIERHGPPELVIADVEMPRMGGLMLARRLGAAHPRVPVLLVSGYASEAYATGLVEFDYLSKPFAPSELTARVRALLDR